MMMTTTTPITIITKIKSDDLPKPGNVSPCFNSKKILSQLFFILTYHMLHTLAPHSCFSLSPHPDSYSVPLPYAIPYYVMPIIMSCYVLCPVHTQTVRNPFLPHPAANHHFTKKETCLDSYPKNRYGTDGTAEPRPCLTLERKSRTTSHHNKLDTYYTTHLLRV
ncbi:uncharacterized protein B0T23DRAFT_184490 [Neurospora hispaniola]|uniref:Uncharacterized protein n=1 Tax=Neurospora hispaniola TaxID=588809 RepID=A0AAJ0I2Z9_9PEZI|nr:hypothetical protein B0T23DRAFT_184490 [Neurospora hispaniola]